MSHLVGGVGTWPGGGRPYRACLALISQRARQLPNGVARVGQRKHFRWALLGQGVALVGAYC
jgi:hypothetical protein